MANSVNLQPQVPGLSIPSSIERPVDPVSVQPAARTFGNIIEDIGKELNRQKRAAKTPSEGSLPGDGTSETERVLASHVSSLNQARDSGSITDTELQVRSDVATQNAINALPSRASALRTIRADQGGELQRQIAPFKLTRRQVAQVETARAKKIVEQQTKADLLGMPVEIYSAYESERFTRDTQKELNKENAAQWGAASSVDFNEDVTALTRQVQQQTGSMLLGPEALLTAKAGIDSIADRVRADAARTSLDGGWSQELSTFNQKLQKWVDREKKSLDELNGSKYLERVNKFQDETIRAGVMVTNPNLSWMHKNAPGLMRQVQAGIIAWNEDVAPIDPNDPKTAEAFKKAKQRWDNKFSHIDGMGLLKENWQTGNPAATRELNTSLETLSNLGVRVPVTKSDAIGLITDPESPQDDLERGSINEAVSALFDEGDGDGMAMIKVTDPAAVQKVMESKEAQATLKTKVINKFNSLVRSYRQDADIVNRYGPQKKLPFGEAYDMKYMDPIAARRNPNKGMRNSFFGVNVADITPNGIEENYRTGSQSLGKIIDTFPDLFEGKGGQEWLMDMTRALLGEPKGPDPEQDKPRDLGPPGGPITDAWNFMKRAIFGTDEPESAGPSAPTAITGGGFGGEDLEQQEEDDVSLETVPETAAQLLHEREGFESSVYADSLGKKTVGAGHLIKPSETYKLSDGRTVKGSSLQIGDEIDQSELNARFESDANKAFVAASSQAEEAGIADPEFLDVLTSVNFQLGTNWTKKFHSSWPAIKRGDFDAAIKGISSSRWAKQTPVRVEDFVNVLNKLKEDKGNADLAKVEPGVYFVNGELVEFS